MNTNSYNWDQLITHEEHDLVFGNTKIVVYDGVFTPHPTISQTASMVIEGMPNVANKRVADIGTGTGVIAVVAARQGAAKVVATDIDDKAIENARKNVVANNVSESVSVVKTSVLDDVAGGFDYIFANIPILEEVWDKLDVNSVSAKLIDAVEKKLKSNGELYIPWGSFAEKERSQLEKLLFKSGFSFTVQTKEAIGYTWYLYKIKKE